jgi:hypothetical protein
VAAPLQIDRIIADRPDRSGGRSLLVKWRGLGYSEATWERESRLTGPGDAEQVERYDRFCVPPAAGEGGCVEGSDPQADKGALAPPGHWGRCAPQLGWGGEAGRRRAAGCAAVA